MNILIISSSIRESASTRRVAMHLRDELAQNESLHADFADLTAYEYPLWKETFHREINPPAECTLLHNMLEASDAMIFVTPEYNGGYSLALKNMIDYFGLKVFEKKAVGVAAVSTGSLGGIRAALQLQQLILAIYAIPVAQMLLVPLVQQRFDSSGKLLDEAFSKNVEKFLTDFLWLAEALYEKKKISMVQK
jgi:NAD(P)H-dependent FMN reductase